VVGLRLFDMTLYLFVPFVGEHDAVHCVLTSAPRLSFGYSAGRADREAGAGVTSAASSETNVPAP